MSQNVNSFLRLALHRNSVFVILGFFLFLLAGSVLIFVTKKADSEELAAKLKTKDFDGKRQCARKRLIKGNKRVFPVKGQLIEVK